MLADSDAGAEQGGLFDDSHQLSQLIGRPTTPYQDVGVIKQPALLCARI
jgi:NAD(P)H dehydrogenase (quinone)